MDENNEKVPQMKAGYASVRQRAIMDNIAHSIECMKELNDWQEREYALFYLLGFIAGEEFEKGDD